MNRFLIIFAASFFVQSLAFSQTERASDLPKPTISNIFSQLELGLSAPQILPVTTEELTGKLTRLKVNPLLAISGDMPIYVERELTRKISLEVSAGVTYDNIFADLIEESKHELEVVKEGKHGVSGSAAIRFYPAEGGDKLERYYFSPEVRFRHYRSTITQLGSYEVALNQSRNITDFKFTMGYLNYIGDNVFIDFYTGFGLRNKMYSNKLEDFAVVYDPESAQTTVKPKMIDKTDNNMLFSLGFKLGFNF